MRKAVLIDTNLLGYFFGIDRNERKMLFLQEYIKGLSNTGWKLYISSQICKEVARISYEKYSLPLEEIEGIFERISKVFNILYEDCQDLKTAILLKERYYLQFWDAIIIASALNNNIPFILSEDIPYREIELHHKKVKLFNPFFENLSF